MGTGLHRYGQYVKTNMKRDQLCHVSIPDAKYHNDVLHPCVRYIPEGFNNHQWWMVQSPWYQCNDQIENPILFYGDTEIDGTPPLHWHFADVVIDTHTQGYNSDPTLHYSHDTLTVVWREFQTPKTKGLGYNSALYAITYDHLFNKSVPKVLIGEPSKVHLTDLSPCINKQGDIYTIDYQIDHSVLWLPHKIISKLSRIFKYPVTWDKTQGVIIYAKTNNTYHPIETLTFKCKKKIIPWHFELLEYNKKEFYIIYCRHTQNLYLGIRQGNYIHINPRPLYSNTQPLNTYKAGGIIINDILYLYYTNKTDLTDPNKNILHRASIDLNQYICEDL